MQTEVKMTYSELKDQVGKNNIGNVYLFEGEEEYLQDYGTALIKNKVIANDDFDIHVLEGSQDMEKFESVMDSFPLFNKNKLILVKHSELFTKTFNSRAEELIKKILDIDENTFMIFREIKTDKDSLFYKGIKKCLRTLSCEQQNDTELIKWVVKIVKSKGYTIDYDTARIFVEMSDRKMNSIMSEINKVLMYKEDDKTIKKNDVELITTKSITDTIFDLTDAVAKKNKDMAVKVLDEMMSLREAEQKILYLITVNFIDMIKVLKARKMNKSNLEIAEMTGIKHDWKVRKLLEFSRKFPENEIRRIIGCCVKADADIKSGLYVPRLSLEILLLEITD
jgi:DNA polymerase III subunit delta